jgi:hypothetical protein
LVERLGIDPGDKITEDGRDDDDCEEEQWNRAHSFIGEKENSEKSEDHEQVGEINLVTTLVELQERAQESSTAKAPSAG